MKWCPFVHSLRYTLTVTETKDYHLNNFVIMDGIVSCHRQLTVPSVMTELSIFSLVIWASWCVKPPDRFVQQLVQVNNTENFKGPHYWPFMKGIQWSWLAMQIAFPCNHHGCVQTGQFACYSKYRQGEGCWTAFIKKLSIWYTYLTSEHPSDPSDKLALVQKKISS